MKNENIQSNKLILGLLLGGVLGAGILYCVHTTQNRKTPPLKRIGKTIGNIGEMLENCEISSGAEILESIEKKIPHEMEIVNSITDLVDTGLTLWKKFKKG